MKRPGPIEFLDRPAYRQRRFRDAARLLPVFACIMMVLPLMWPRGVPGEGLTSSGIIYLFGLWSLLIACAFVLSRLLRNVAPPPEDGRAESGRVEPSSKDQDVHVSHVDQGGTT